VKDFAAYVAPRLIGESKSDHDAAELNRVCDFISKHVAKGEMKKSRDHDDIKESQVLEAIELENLNAMLKHFSTTTVSSDSETGVIEDKPLAE